MSKVKVMFTRRRIFFGVLMLLVLLLISLFATIFYVKKWVSSENAPAKIETLLEQFTGGDVSFKSFDIDKNLKNAVSKDFNLSMPDGSSYSFKSGAIKLDYGSLFRGVLVIEKLIVDEPEFVLSKSGEMEDAEEAINFPDRPLLPLLRVKVLDARIGNASVVHPDGHVNGLKLTGAGEIDSAGLFLKGTLVTTRQSSLIINSGSIKAKATPDLITTFKLDKSGRYIVAAKGALSPIVKADAKPKFSTLSANLNMVGDLHYPRISAEFVADLDKVRFLKGGAKAEKAGGDILYDASIEKLTADLEKLMSAFGVEEKGFNLKGFVDSEKLSVVGQYDPTGAKRQTSTISGSGVAKIDFFKTDKITLAKGATLTFNLNELKRTTTEYQGDATATLVAPLVKGAEGFIVKGVEADIVVALSSTIKDKKDEKLEQEISVEGKIDRLKTSGIESRKLAIFYSGKGDYTTGNLANVLLTVTDKSKNSFVTVKGDMDNFGRDDVNFNLKYQGDLKGLKSLAKRYDTPFNATHGVITGVAKMTGKFGEEWNNPRLKIETEAKGAKVGGVWAKDKEIKLGSSSFSLNASGLVNPLGFLTDLKLESFGNAKNLELGNAGKIGKTQFLFTLSSPHPVHDKVAITLKGSANGIKAASSKNKTFGASYELVAKTDPVSKRNLIEKINIDLGKAGSINGKGEYDAVKNQFSSFVSTKKLDLAAMSAIVPAKFLPIKKITGILDLTADFVINSPLKISTNNFYPFPGLGEVNIKLSGGSGKIDAQKISIRGADVDLVAKINGAKLHLEGGVWIESFKSPNLFGGASVDPTLELDIDANSSALQINRFVADTRSLGFVESIEGKIDRIDIVALQKVINGAAAPGRLLAGLKANLSNYTAISLDEAQQLIGDMSMGGDLILISELSANRNKNATSKGLVEVTNFSYSDGENIKVNDVTGTFPFEKSLQFILAENSPKDFTKVTKKYKENDTKSGGVRDTSFFEDLQAASPEKENFSVKEVDVGPISLREILFNFTFIESRLGIDSFRTRFESGGGLSGSSSVNGSDKGYEFRSTHLFAGLDLSKLLLRDLKLKSDETIIDGSMTVQARMSADEELAKVDLSKIDVAFHLTRIDGKALDRVLKFIDPNESSPAVVNARTLLRFAKPVSVDVIARYGMLSVEMDLQYSPLLGGQTVTMPVVKKAPIQGLVNFEAIRESVNRLSFIQPMIKAVGSTRLIIAEDGEMTLR